MQGQQKVGNRQEVFHRANFAEGDGEHAGGGSKVNEGAMPQFLGETRRARALAFAGLPESV